MNTVMTMSRQTRWTASVVAALATLLTAGGPLMLAEHYAQIGASWNASGYYASAQSRGIACSDQGDSRIPVTSTRRSAENS
ncbi:MAG: hypothetical protein WCV99_06395 [Sterolibacterium sp.]